MKDLMVKTTMTSMEIAEVTGKQHQHIMRDIRDEAARLENAGIDTQSKFGLSERTDSTSRKIPYYQLTQEGVLQLAARYDAVVRAKLIERVMQTENHSSQVPVAYPPYPSSSNVDYLPCRWRPVTLLARTHQILKREAERTHKTISSIAENYISIGLGLQRPALDKAVDPKACLATPPEIVKYKATIDEQIKRLHRIHEGAVTMPDFCEISRTIAILCETASRLN